MKKILVLVVVIVIPVILTARPDSTIQKRIYSITKLSGDAPVIDGSISDKAWEEAEWSGDFIQHMPHSGKKPSFPTRFKICYDADHIYVAIESFDNATDSIDRRLTRRDDMEGDHVMIGFDSYHDLRTAFIFAVNAGGAKADLIMSEDGNSEDETWNPVWWVKTSVGTDRWLAEMKIPFSQLRFDNSLNDTWGLEVSRYIFRLDETSFWQHIPPESPGVVHMFGQLNGMKGIMPHKQAEVIPYFTSGLESYESDPDNPFRTGRNMILNTGLDAKIGVTNNLTLDLSVNPDFGQVEADPSEVNLTAYESFFQEKRPFFIEGKNIFDFPLEVGNGGSRNLFYSRRIGQRPHYTPDLSDGEFADQPEQTTILAAAKLSGKTKGGTSIGILESVTAEEFATIDKQGERSHVAVEPLTNYFVGRVLQDLNNGNTILGGIVTSTYRDIKADNLSFLPVSATTGGINFQQYWGNKSYNIQFVNYFSHVTGTTEAITRLQESPSHIYQRPDADYLQLDTSRTSLSGMGGTLQFWKTSGKFNALASVIWKSPGLDVNDLGYFRMGDEITEMTWFRYSFYEPFSIFRQLHVSATQFRAWDFGGYKAIGGIDAGVSTNFINFWSTHIGYQLNGPVRLNSFLRGGPSILLPAGNSFFLSVSSDERKKLAVETDIHYVQGSENYENDLSLGLEFEYRPINALNLSLEPEYMKSYAVLQYVDQFEQQGEQRYIFSSIDQTVLALSLRANLTITPELTIQYWGQPFIASGDFYDFKHITNGTAASFTDRFHQYSPDEISYVSDEDQYYVNELESGLDSYTIDNPDFGVSEFLSNMVIRWEYRPGSYLYLVWTQSREESESGSTFGFSKNINRIWNIRPVNVFMLKFSYRIGR
ncbi:MAG: carbohydrate binding family 9 domain-containing protein [Bacteroidales bacterium]|nr:carbohydrate binding family 9 domain-containing protein [Bacteroidales bacterium]